MISFSQFCMSDGLSVSHTLTQWRIVERFGITMLGSQGWPGLLPLGEGVITVLDLESVLRE